MSTNAYMAAYMLRRYHQRRAEAVANLGGRCVVCGSHLRLEIDHVNRFAKEFDLGHLWSVSRNRYLSELAKCQLLCQAHHKAKSISERSVDHGGGVSGKRNCKCRPCRSRKREYMRDRKAALLTAEASA